MPSLDHQRQGAWILLTYVLLASVYLLYLPHAEFVLDDWFVLGRYQQAREAGGSAPFHVFQQIVQNQFHGQFRFQWLSFSLGYLLWLLAGYSPRVVFLASLGLHVGCALAWRRVLVRLGVPSATAVLAGALFLLLPTTHGALLWSFNCTFFLWSTLWFLLYLGSLAETLRAERLETGAAARQALFLLLALFSGDPVFGLLVAAAPLAGWWLRSRATVSTTLLAWGVLAVAVPCYALVVNRAPVLQAGVGVRYEFTPASIAGNLATIFATYRKLTGWTADSYYHLRASGPALAAAGLAVAVAAWWWRRAPVAAPAARHPLWLAGGLWAAAYGPILFIRGHEFRYDYVPSPYLALALATAVLAGRALSLPLAAGLLAWLAMASVADLQQSWIPQSEDLRAVAGWLKSARGVEPRDLFIASGTTQWIGTAPHFAFLAGWGSSPWAEHVTGVRGVEAACEIVEDRGRLRVYHRNYMRDWGPQEAAHTHVVLVQGARPPAGRTLLAREVETGGYELYALSGYRGPAIESRLYARDQLAIFEDEVYFARRLSDLVAP